MIRAVPARWLAETTPDVLTAATWARKPESGINLAVTYAGLEKLGVPGTSLAGFPTNSAPGWRQRRNSWVTWPRVRPRSGRRPSTRPARSTSS